MQRFKRLTIEGIWVIIGQLAVSIGSLLLVRFLTEYLSPVQYGQLALGLTLATLVNQIIMGGIGISIGRFYSIAIEKHELLPYLHASRDLLIYATGGVVITGLLLVIALYIFGYSQWIALALSALLFSVFNGYNVALSSIHNASRQRLIVALHAMADSMLKILITLSIMRWFGTSVTGVIIAYVCSSLLITASQLLFLRRDIPQQHKFTQKRKEYRKQMWNYSMPFSIWGVFSWMHQVSDRWALQAFASDSDVGRYAAIYQLGYTPIILLTGMAISFFEPILYRRAGDATDPNRNADVHRLGWHMTYISIIITIVGWVVAFFLHEWLYTLLVNVEYRESSYLFPWIVLAGGIFSAGQVLALKLMSEMKLSNMTIAKIVTALIGTMLNLMGAALAGIEGVVGALIVFSIIYFVWMVILSSGLNIKV